jgi:hypothetical protein
MRRWLLWFVVAPQCFLVAGLWRDAGLPPLDVGVVLALYLGWFADRKALAFLLFGAAIGRAIVDEASLPVQILVLGVPIAALLPLRSLFVAQRWLWQAVAAALLAIALPSLAALCGRWFDQPSAGAVVVGWQVVWSALLAPVVLSGLRRLPPFRSFEEVSA